VNANRAPARDQPLLPGAAKPALWLALAMFILSMAAGLELAGASAAIRAAVAWSPRLAGSVTVAVGGGGLESPEAAAARATEILARASGVTRIAVLEPDSRDRLAGRLMGVPQRSGDEEDAEPPRLIAATFDAGDRAAAAAISDDLRSANVAAAVDDHGLWTGPLERTAVIAAAAAAVVLLVLAALAWAFAAASIRAAVRARTEQVGLLLHLGASDDMILRPFRARVVGGAALGALIGVGAAAFAATFTRSPVVSDWINRQAGALIGSAPIIDAWDLAAAAIWLPLVVLIAVGAGHSAARAELRALA
jgi:cell division transport system permease protein